MYTVPPLSNEFVALEALQIDVKKRQEGKVTKETVYNTLQQYRGEIQESMARAVELDQEMTDEFLNTAMTLQYQNRAFELSSDLLSCSVQTNDYANRGDLNIIPIAQSQTLTNRINAYKGPIPSYNDAKASLRALRLYTTVIKSLVSYFSKDLFLEVETVSKSIEAVRSKLESFETPFCKFVTKGDNEAYTLEEVRQEFPKKETSISEAGWTITRIVDFQVQLDDEIVKLSKAIFEIAQAANRFSMNPSAARSYSLFNTFFTPLTEAVARVPVYVIFAHKQLWHQFKTGISLED